MSFYLVIIEYKQIQLLITNNKTFIMAEIKIEKKKTIWPWILLALLLLAGVLYFVFADSDVEEYEDDTITIEEVGDVDAIAVVPANSEAIAAYDETLTAYTQYIGNTEKMGIDHVYSNNALEYLIEAVEAKAAVLNIDIEADLEKARKNANAITNDPYDVNHADLIKNTGMILVSALKTIQMKSFPSLDDELAAVNDAVMAINKETHTLDQKDDVNTFYKAAESLLIKMQ